MVSIQRTNNRWTMSLPGAAVKGIAECRGQASVPVVMTGKPDGPDDRQPGGPVRARARGRSEAALRQADTSKNH
jgi:hypothetical protein